jgi:hypothetical protein
MVQPPENWAYLEGIAEAVRPSDTNPDLAVVDIAVEEVSADPDERLRNLFGEAAGTVVPVLVPRNAIEELEIAPGMRMRCRARKASPFHVFADPDAVTVLGRPHSQGQI